MRRATVWTRMAITAVLLLFASLGACEWDDGTIPWDHNGNDPYDTYRERCVDQINAYRATLDLPPYGRWTDAESCADDEARQDSETGTAHGAFGQCSEHAQNECPGWPSLDAAVTGCLDMMWAEGPGEPFSAHGHYINMSSTQYTEVACGFYVTDSGSVWAVQDFR